MKAWKTRLSAWRSRDSSQAGEGRGGRWSARVSALLQPIPGLSPRRSLGRRSDLCRVHEIGDTVTVQFYQVANANCFQRHIPSLYITINRVKE